MKQNYPFGDLEREYLVDDTLAQEDSYIEYLKLSASSENATNTKIEIGDVKIKDYQEGPIDHRDPKTLRSNV